MTAPENKPPIPHPPITEATREFVKAQAEASRVASALEESIAHWERLAAGTQAADETVSSYSCALCREFFAVNRRCDGCPVDDRTGAGCTDDSPWLEAYWSANHYGINSPEFRAAAQRELDFLKSLRPASDAISNQKDAES